MASPFLVMIHHNSYLFITKGKIVLSTLCDGFLRNFLFFIFFVFLIFFFENIEFYYLGFIYFLSILFTFIFSIIFLKKNRFADYQLKLPAFGTFINSSRLSFFSISILNNIQKNSDLIFMSFFLNLFEVALVAIFLRMINVFRQFSNIFVNFITKDLISGELMNYKKIREIVFKLLIIVSFIVLIISLFSKPILGLWDSKFSTYNYYLIILLFSSIFSVITSPFRRIVVIKGYEKKLNQTQFVFTFISSLLLIILGYVFGLLGVCIALALKIFFENLDSIFLCSKLLILKINNND